MGLPVIKIRAEDVIFESKLENLSGKGEPREIIFKGEKKILEMKADGSPVIVRQINGKPARMVRLDKSTGQVFGECSNMYMTEDGELAETSDVDCFYQAGEELIPAQHNVVTGELVITSFMPEGEYIDDYVIDKYYQVVPYNGKSKNNKTKEAVRDSNIASMKRLWDKLALEGVVGKGQVSLSSAGWLPSVAFIRAIRKEYWTLEIGIARQRKQFTWKEEHSFKLTAKERAGELQHEEL